MSGISIYKGEWSKTQVIHLIKRTMFGARKTDIQFFSTLSLQQAINQLLMPQSAATPPLNNYTAIDTPDVTGIEYGQTWVKGVHNGDIDGNRRSSFKAWMLGRMIHQERSLEEKMTLFWHNHFSTEMDNVNDARFSFNYFETIRRQALGNFKKMVKEMTIDPAMLIYLNGSVNTKTAPDENYGRELQELFTIGKGTASKYTEDDVKAAARILTGYRHKRDTISYTFTPDKHDDTDKQFSAFYGSKIIKGQGGGNGEKELDELLNLIFAQPEVANHICRKLYRFFVYYDITDAIEKEVINPLAAVFIKNNFEIKPVLQTLFSSEHFFDMLNIGAVIKSPLDHVVGFIREFEVVLPTKDNFKAQYAHWKWLRDKSRDFSQDPGDPPNVSGWPAYYQFPQYHELWVNADTFPKRTQFTDQLLTNGYNNEGFRMIVDYYGFASKLQNPEDPNKLIQESIDILFALDIDQKVKDGLKTDILLDGQSLDYYWTDEWNTFKANPKDEMAAKTVLTRLQNLYKFLTASAEYQLS